MYLLRNRMNTNSFFIILKPYNHLLQTASVCLNNTKHFHLSQIHKDSDDDHKNKSSKDQKSERRAKLANFSFIEVKPSESTPAKTVATEKAPVSTPKVTTFKMSPNVSKQQAEKPASTQRVTTFKMSPSFNQQEKSKQTNASADSTHRSRINTLDDMKNNRLKSLFKKSSSGSSASQNRPSIFDKIRENATRNTERFQSKGMDPSLATKLAKMIDAKNQEATVEMLMNPVIKTKQKPDVKGSEASKKNLDLRSILEDIKKERANRPNSIDFKQLMLSTKGDYTSLRNESDNKLDRRLNPAIMPSERKIRHYNFDNVIEYSGQEGNRFEMKHRLGGGSGLSIFQDQQTSVDGHVEQTRESPIWQMHYQEQLEDMEVIPPINGFEEMIMLTNQGKLWNFPIDNEQGVDENEAEVSFSDHVFLDSHLEQFPDIAPVQEFMTLVLNGLSKNSFLSVDEKETIIDWYRNYFDEKKDLILEALNAERQEAEYREQLELQKKQNASKSSSSQ